jgi:hypothetical protein
MTVQCETQHQHDIARPWGMRSHLECVLPVCAQQGAAAGNHRVTRLAGVVALVTGLENSAARADAAVVRDEVCDRLRGRAAAVVAHQVAHRRALCARANGIMFRVQYIQSSRSVTKSARDT